ncbi:holo-ACP synthase [Spirochaeta dissipatitropha]
MIFGIGTDIVKVDRFDKWMESGISSRCFHPDELNYCLGRGLKAAEAMAARFAAKEAFGKALGTGIRGFALREVEVRQTESGRPLLKLHGKAGELAASVGIVNTHVSLSHEREYATAVVVLEG